MKNKLIYIFYTNFYINPNSNKFLYYLYKESYYLT